jgi:hypothetical protein
MHLLLRPLEVLVQRLHLLQPMQLLQPPQPMQLLQLMQLMQLMQMLQLLQLTQSLQRQLPLIILLIYKWTKLMSTVFANVETSLRW